MSNVRVCLLLSCGEEWLMSGLSSQRKSDIFTLNSWSRIIPIGRFGRAEDIAAAVVFFCLPEAEWMAGQTLLIDGGHISYLRED